MYASAKILQGNRKTKTHATQSKDAYLTLCGQDLDYRERSTWDHARYVNCSKCLRQMQTGYQSPQFS